MSIRNSAINKTAVFIITGFFSLFIMNSCKEDIRVTPKKQLKIVTDESAVEAGGTIIGIMERVIMEKCSAEIVADAQDAITIILKIEAGIGNEGFKIEEKDGRIEIIGNDRLGLLYGVGKFLHTSGYKEKEGFLASPWRGTSVPEASLRAMYFATHFDNYYMAAPIKDVKKYVEDISLWGFNTIFFKFATYEYNGMEDPFAIKNLSRIKQLMILAKDCGLKVGITNTTNGGFKTAPIEILATPVPDGMHRRGWHGVNICPGTKAGSDYILEIWHRIFDELIDVGVDYFRSWPYDSGGCGCEKCWPWGAKGYLNISEKVSVLAKTKYPNLKFILATWMYDTPECGEWKGLTASMNKDNSWADYIMADSHDDFPEYPLLNGIPGNLPLVNFPEISMWGQEPWGGFGANPMPNRFQKIWNQAKDKLSGGVPYSEGIYEDINKVIYSQFYWEKDKKATETVREYIAFYFSPEVVTDMMKIISLMEENHERHKITTQVEEVYTTIQNIEPKLDINTSQSWRWRLLYLRAKIDYILYANQQKNQDDKLKIEYVKVMNIVKNQSLKAYGALGASITYLDILVDYQYYYKKDGENIFLKNYSDLMSYFLARYPDVYEKINENSVVIEQIFEEEYYQTNHISKQEYLKIKSCFKEITDIYHAKNAFMWVQPYQLP